MSDWFDMNDREQDITIQAFTELAPAYEETVDQELRQFWGVGYREFVGYLIAKIDVSKDSVILDVATGKALIPNELAARHADLGTVIGLDITPAMLVEAQELIRQQQATTRVRLVCGSAMAIPFPGNLFDIVICGLAMHHMQAKEMLLEYRRVLKPGGKLLMADVGASTFWRSVLGKITLQILLFHHGLTQKGIRAQAEREAFDNIYTTAEWRALLTAFGYSELDIVQFKARYPWYPSGLIISARAEED